MKRPIIYIICLSGLVLSGCAFTSPELTHEYVDHGIKAIDRNTEMRLAIAQANPDLDPVKVAEAASSFEKQIESIDKAFNEIRKEIAEEKRQRENIVAAFASLAIETLPAGSSALTVAKALGFKIDTATDKALIAANEKTEEVETIVSDNKVKIDNLTNDTKGITKDTKNLKDRIDKIEEDTETLTDEKDAVEHDLEIARLKFDSLSTSLQEKLGKVPESLIADLTKLKADDAAFREKLQRELQLTDAEMESLKGVTTEQILGLLIAASAATGAGRYLTTHGPSREHDDIRNLRTDLTVLSKILESKPTGNQSGSGKPQG